VLWLQISDVVMPNLERFTAESDSEKKYKSVNIWLIQAKM